MRAAELGPVDVSIVTSGHDVADARIHRLGAALIRSGLSLEVLGLGDERLGPTDASVVVSPRQGPVGRARLAATYAARARGRVLIAMDPDSLVAARVIGGWRGRRVVADVHEDYAALLKDRAWATGLVGRAAATLVNAASRAARAADLTIVADEHVPPMAASRRLVLRNLPYVAFLPTPKEPDPELRALYIGDVRATRGLWHMLEAIEGAPGWSLDVVGPIAAADRSRLNAQSEAGRSGRVKFHDRLPPQQAWALAGGAACGFVLLDDTPAFREAMPSKLYEYVAAGLPVVVSDLPRQREFVDRFDVGAVVPAGEASGPATADVLRRWALDQDELARLRANCAGFARDSAGWVDEYDAAVAAVADLL